jgi:hypothetical protein
MPVAVIEKGLRGITLPALVRPPVGPHDEPTHELVCWGVQSYVYSSIAHLRNILDGLTKVAASGNRPVVLVIGRHVYEWTANACYMRQEFEKHLRQNDLKSAWELFLEFDTGNTWIKNHGTKYLPEVDNDDVPKTPRVNKMVKAYSAYQLKARGNDTAENDYGYLSEHSHANGMCFLDYRRLDGPELTFVEAESRYDLPGVLEICTTEWVLFACQLLGLAQESAVRNELVKILHSVAESVKKL